MLNCSFFFTLALMENKQLITDTIAFVKETLKGAEGGHDWFHIERVYYNAIRIAAYENANDLVVALGALLHDIADAKFHNGDSSIGPKMARAFLEKKKVSESVIKQIEFIINNISYSSNIDSTLRENPIELSIVQDADRLDAMGAIGIARTFNYGGFKNRLLYDPAIKPNLKQTKEQYQKSTTPTINHFYEKLLLLKDLMNTKTGKKMAQERHDYMLGFLKQFYREVSIG